jgi:hypothetical protein
MGFLNAMKRPLQPVTRSFSAWRYLRRLRERPELGLDVLFDAAYYRSFYRGRLPPLMHFIIAGAYQGANPHPLFDSAFYLGKYPDLAASGVNPLLHYLLHGAAEGRKPHPLFQPSYYLEQISPASTPAQPLLHFLAAENPANPHPLFDCRAYRDAYPEAASKNPLVDFVKRGGTAATEGGQLGLEDA